MTKQPTAVCSECLRTLPAINNGTLVRRHKGCAGRVAITAERPANRVDVVISDASDKDGGGATLRCKHGTDIVNHAPCRLCEPRGLFSAYSPEPIRQNREDNHRS